MQGKEGNTLHILYSLLLPKDHQESSILRKVQGRLKDIDKYIVNQSSPIIVPGVIHKQDLDANTMV